MLISHKYRFIFMKTCKTGGTSLEVDFNKVMDDNDVVTTVQPLEEGHRPRNMIQPNGRVLHQHSDVDFVRSFVGPSVWDTYFKFCFEREPVDKCLSDYYHLTQDIRHRNMWKMSWSEYVFDTQPLLPIDTAKYTDKSGRCVVDRICKYENFDQEVKEVAKIVGLPIDRVTARSKSGFRRHDIIPSREEKEHIYKMFASSLVHTGYTLKT